jgi:hypothetical protein
MVYTNGRTRACILAVAVACSVLASSAGAAPLAESTFSLNDEGWSVVTTLDYSGPATYSSTGGNPGGFIYAQDPDTGAFGFLAPATFLGDKSAAYGQTFSFDVAAYDTPSNPTSWVGLYSDTGGPGGAAIWLARDYTAPTSTYPTWHSRSVVLDESDGWVDVDTGFSVSQAVFQDVLADLDAVVITTEFVEGLETDISGLDNVVMMPEPATMGLLAAGLAAVLARRHRR